MQGLVALLALLATILLIIKMEPIWLLILIIVAMIYLNESKKD